MTPAQQAALEQWLPHYQWPDAAPVSPRLLLPGARGVDLEIGFGNGEALLAAARADPTRLQVGIEVHRPGVGRLLREAAAADVHNLRVVVGDAVDWLRVALPAGCLDSVRVFFPDPWPKARHHKRRLIQPEFVALIADRLRVGGRLLLTTDWLPYAEHMAETLAAAPAFTLISQQRPAERPLTRFELRGLRLGHSVTDLAYCRVL